jgi:hypothetical protein
LKSYSPEDGKTGIERPALAAGLPNFRYYFKNGNFIGEFARDFYPRRPRK